MMPRSCLSLRYTPTLPGLAASKRSRAEQLNGEAAEPAADGGVQKVGRGASDTSVSSASAGSSGTAVGAAASSAAAVGAEPLQENKDERDDRDPDRDRGGDGDGKKNPVDDVEDGSDLKGVDENEDDGVDPEIVKQAAADTDLSGFGRLVRPTKCLECAAALPQYQKEVPGFCSKGRNPCVHGAPPLCGGYAPDVHDNVVFALRAPR